MATAAQIVLIVVLIVTYVVSLVIAYINGQPNASDIFSSSNGEVDRKYYQQVSPAGTAFSIVWPVIYLWNFAGILYIFVSMFLSPEKSPVNFKPTLIPYSFLISYILLFGSTLAWLFVFDREILWLSFVVLIFAVATAYFTVGVSYKRVYDNLPNLDTKESVMMLRLVRGIIQNGICLPATWLTVASMLGLTQVIIYEPSYGLGIATKREISVEDGSTIVLSILFALIILWFILENFVWEKYCRYTFTIYPVFILAFSGLIAKLRVNGGERNMILASVELSFCILAFIAKICLFFYRRKSRSVNSEADLVKTP